jgi:hypothetical protein
MVTDTDGKMWERIGEMLGELDAGLVPLKVLKRKELDENVARIRCDNGKGGKCTVEVWLPAFASAPCAEPVAA